MCMLPRFPCKVNEHDIVNIQKIKTNPSPAEFGLCLFAIIFSTNDTSLFISDIFLFHYPGHGKKDNQHFHFQKSNLLLGWKARICQGKSLKIAYFCNLYIWLLKYEDFLKYQMTSSNKKTTINEYDLKHEDNIKYEDNLKYKGNLKMKTN